MFPVYAAVAFTRLLTFRNTKPKGVICRKRGASCVCYWYRNDCHGERGSNDPTDSVTPY